MHYIKINELGIYRGHSRTGVDVLRSGRGRVWIGAVGLEAFVSGSRRQTGG